VTGTFPPGPTPPPPGTRKKLTLFAIGLLALAAFMYGSIIVKTALMGP
jgi:hypothetical protein